MQINFNVINPKYRCTIKTKFSIIFHYKQPLTMYKLRQHINKFISLQPFVLSTAGRQWIFGGELSKVEGRAIRPYWALLFSDLLLFATVSRDRVLFVTEEPVALGTVSDAQFNVRKKGK